MKATQRFVCLHGHFYQPPRENPWLGQVERQLSAAPYHDWNERILAECYEANTQAKILDASGHVHKVLNNYEWISFNFGPTLLDWMEKNAPRAYEKILKADVESQKHFDGHGSAMAQVFNHAILPLQTRQEKNWQVKWGLADFQKRFGRAASGMWLAETAVDVETLEVLAENQVKFTILAPHQAAAIRPMASDVWQPVDENLDTTQAYLCPLPSGRSISIFFYHGAVSRAVAFEKILDHAETFKNRLEGIFSDSNVGPQLAHIATDGESYGHHHRHGEMALAYVIKLIQDDPHLALTNYAQYLDRFGTQHQVLVNEPSAWSCPHGVGRWFQDCGCKFDLSSGSQAWRGPLREAIRFLADEVLKVVQKKFHQWGCPDLSVLNEVGPILFSGATSLHLLKTNLKQINWSAIKDQDFLELVEMLKYSQWAFTSCAWFFDDVARLEPRQNLFYAERALEILQKYSGTAPREIFLDILGQAQSHRRPGMSARDLFLSEVQPSRRGLDDMVAQMAFLKAFDCDYDFSKVFKFQWTDVERSFEGSLEMRFFQVHVQRLSNLEEAEFEGVLELGWSPRVNLRFRRHLPNATSEQQPWWGSSSLQALLGTMRVYSLAVLSYDQRELIRQGPLAQLQRLLHDEVSLFE